jgi:hypothetical protein
MCICHATPDDADDGDIAEAPVEQTQSPNPPPKPPEKPMPSNDPFLGKHL